MVATGDVAVPVALGFHPYLAPPGPREGWVLTAAVGERFELDERLVPTGSAVPAVRVDGPLSDRALDDSYTVAPPRTLAVEDGGRRLEVALGAGFPLAQIFAPPGERLVALEPMAAPSDALVSRRHLAVVPPGEPFEASFRVNVR